MKFSNSIGIIRKGKENVKTEKEEIEKHIYLIETEKALILGWIVEGKEVGEESVEDVIVEEILGIERGMTEEKEKTEKIEKGIHKHKIFR